MSAVNTARFGTAFCEAIDAAEGITTGISAYDRAHTIRVAMDQRRGLRIWPGQAMCFRCVRAPAECSYVQANRGGGGSRASCGTSRRAA